MSNSITLIPALLLTLTLSRFLNSLIASFALARSWCDTPGTAKIHTRPVPWTGGIGIFLAWTITLAILIFLIPPPPILTPLLIGAGAALLLGFLDDIRWKNRSLPIPKLTLQVILALIVSFLLLTAGTRLISYHPLIHLSITASLILTSINALNLADGIDGLAGGEATISILGLAVYFFNQPETPPFLPLALLFLVAAIIGFLLLNLCSPSRLFLGDGGTHLLGAILGVLLTTVLGRSTSLPYSIIAVALILGIPLFDIIWVLGLRLYYRQPLLAPDRNHIYDKIIALGISPRATTILLWFLHALTVATGVTLLLLEVK